MDKFLIALAVWNVFVMILFGADKIKSKHNKRRTPEKTLILSAFLFGSLGALLGMLIFRHKTNHMSFKILIPVALFLNIAIFYLYYRYIR